MAILDRLPWRKPRELTSAEITGQSVDMRELVENYDIVSVNEGLDGSSPFIVVTNKESDWEPTLPVTDNSVESRMLADRLSADTREIGTSSPSPFTSFTRKEYNAELAGLKGLQVYDKMRRSDGTVRGTLRALKTPVLAGRWFVSPASEKKIDLQAAEFVWKNLTELMSISWTQVLTEAMLMTDFGYYMFEKVWIDGQLVDGKRRTIYQKLAPRHPMDVKSWLYDGNGGPAGVVMYGRQQTGGFQTSNLVPTTVNGREVPQGGAYAAGIPIPGVFNARGEQFVHEDESDILIPIDKLLVFSFDREAGNIEGLSVLRSAYKHWFYKEQLYKIDAIQKERHGIGIPVIKLPPNYSPDDKKTADQLGRNLRTNERAHVVLPPNWELLFAKLEGHVVDALKSAEHHNAAIRENILAPFLGENTTTKVEDQTMFLKASRFIADIVCDTFNMYGIPQLVDYNFTRAGYPRLRARRIGETEDQRTFSFTVRNLVGAGVLIPDDPFEVYARDVLDLPPMDPSTRRPTQLFLQEDNQKFNQEMQQKQFDAAQKAAKLAAKQAAAGPVEGGGAPGTAPEAGSGQPGQPGTKGQPGRPGHSGKPGKPGSTGRPAGASRQQPTPPSGPPRSNSGTDRSGGK